MWSSIEIEDMMSKVVYKINYILGSLIIHIVAFDPATLFGFFPSAVSDRAIKCCHAHVRITLSKICNA